MKMKKKYFVDSKKKIKKEIRLIGIDDSPFEKGQKGEILLIGTIHRGGYEMEGVISTFVEIDGTNSTERITTMINNSRHKDQLQCIMTDGIAVGGFNVIDINKLADDTNLPVIVIVRQKPDLERVESALRNVSGFEEKIKLIRKAGKIYEYKFKEGKIHFQASRITIPKARQIIKTSVSRGHMPEAIRTSHIIATGVVRGESKGRA